MNQERDVRNGGRLSAPSGSTHPQQSEPRGTARRHGGRLPASRGSTLSLLAPVLALGFLTSWTWPGLATAVGERPFSREATVRRELTVEPDEVDVIRTSLADSFDALFRSRIIEQRDSSFFGSMHQIVRERLHMRFRRGELAVFGVWHVDDLIRNSSGGACACDVELTGRARFQMDRESLQVDAGLESISNADLDCGACAVSQPIEFAVRDTQYLVPEQRITDDLSNSVTVSTRRPVFTLPAGFRATDVDVATDVVPVSVRYDDSSGLVLTADVRIRMSGVLEYPDTASAAVLADAETSLDGSLLNLRRRLVLRLR